MKAQKANQLFLFKRIANISTSADPDTWALWKRIIIKEMPEFENICMQYHFKITKGDAVRDPTHIIFARQERIFTLDLNTEQVQTVYEFDTPLTR